MEIVDITAVARKTEFRVFRGTADKGGFVRGIPVKDAATKYSRRQIDALTDYVKQDFGAKGLAWFRVEEDGTLWSPISKNLEEEHLAEIKELMGGQPGDLLMFLADSWEVTCKGLAGLRKRLANELGLIDPNELNCSWVTEFPMFERDEESGRWNAMHHPFTAPLESDLALLADDPQDCRAQAYDLVINGSEAGGGTIRIHDPKTQSQVFELLGIDEQTAEDRFGFLLNALEVRCAAPRRHRAGRRPLGHAVCRPGKYPRSHRISQDPKSDRLDDRSAGRSRHDPVDGVAPPSGQTQRLAGAWHRTLFKSWPTTAGSLAVFT